MTDTSALMTIGQFSAATRISVRMLRHYADNGVLAPAYVDDATGYRWYAPAQVDDAIVVRQLRDVGFGVPAIGALMAARGDSTFGRALDQQRAALVDNARGVSHQIALIDRMRQAHHPDPSGQPKETNVSVQIDQTNLAARTVVAVRGTIPTYTDEGILWGQLMPEMARQGITPIGPCGAIDLADEYQERDVDKEVYAPVAPGTTAEDPLTVRELAETPAVRATLTGPFEGISEACDQLARWVASHGHQATGGMHYIYLKDMETTPPEELVTEIYLPVAQ
ncbi:MerR family transcriptional regulator [Parenemella sanctibonifatiensis]|uniref:MerR family transcriptional regulator n=1 Tax=Parenemella sanctibonifatiensis TaxID=2016505 RepID=A0A255ECB6_9ACTN|nr:MerR family transcriptional regulator [Parenemella sanctibonifatiensis]OYN89208.1 MerR family transcriptional regulator [Parenemella sanctibonifatiensis]